MPQGLTVVKSEPLAAPSLSVVKSEPLQAATPPPAPASTGRIHVAGGSRSFEASREEAVHGMAEPVAAGVGATLAAGAVTAAAPEVAGVAGLVGVARAVPWLWRAGAGLASVVGAGIGGGAEAAAEGKPLTTPDRTPADVIAGRPAPTESIAASAAWQAKLQAMGLPVGWLANFAGRRIMGTTVAKQALEKLGLMRAQHVEEAQGVFTAAQDALDAHAKQQAQAKLGELGEKQALTQSAEQTKVVGESEAARLRGQWPSAEGPPPTVAQPPAATPPPSSSGPVEPYLAGAAPGSAAAVGAPMVPVPAHTSLESALRAEEQNLHIGGRPTPPNPERGPGGMVLGQPRPMNAAHIDQQMAARDVMQGRVEGGAATPPPSPLFATGHRTGMTGPPAPPPMAPVPAHVPAGPSHAARASQQAEAVISGPAQTSKEQLGAAVEGAAETGPHLSIAPLKQRLTAMLEQATPAAGAPTVPPNLVLTPQEAATLAASKRAGLTEEQFRAHINKTVPVEKEHPLPGVLDKIMKAGDGTDEDLVSFADLHKMKRLLDDAIGWRPAGAVQAPARGQLKQITKGIRGGIRETMAAAEHQPYEQATEAYRKVSTLYAPGGLARRIQATAAVDPEAIVNSLVSPRKPGQLRMLKEVLTHHAEQGGGPEGAAEGQQAWAAVQSTVMYKHLIQPGIDKWEASLAKMSPEFLHTLTEEPHAKAVFTRLSSIAQAVKASEAQTAAESGVKAAQLASHATGVAEREAQARVTRVGLQRGVREASRGVTEARRSSVTPRPGEDQVGRMLTDQEDAFAKSSLGKPPSTTSQVSDLAYAVTAPPGSPRQIAGAARLLWRGPKANDLIHWASLSDDNTQMLVRAVSGPNSALAVSNLMRGVETLYQQHAGGPRMAVGHAQTPQAQAAVPPPGPRR